MFSKRFSSKKTVLERVFVAEMILEAMVFEFETVLETVFEAETVLETLVFKF